LINGQGHRKASPIRMRARTSRAAAGGGRDHGGWATRVFCAQKTGEATDRRWRRSRVVDTAHGPFHPRLEGRPAHQRLSQRRSGGRRHVATGRGPSSPHRCGRPTPQVRIWPGAILQPTRIVAGVGMSQLTAIMDSRFDRAPPPKTPVIATSHQFRRLAKAMPHGAREPWAARCSSTAGDAGEVFLNQAALQTYRGMGSVSAMAARLGRPSTSPDIKDSLKLVPKASSQCP